MFPEFSQQDSQEFLDGSARIALQVQPRFTKYIFIEQDENRFAKLKRLKEDFPAVKDDIMLVNADANTYLQDICRNYSWHKNRAVLFLDPFGMQVKWDTIVAIAETQAIDLWLLFPLGVAVNSSLSTRFLLFEQENLPQRHRVTEKRKFIKNSVSPCLCGSILFGSGLSRLGCCAGMAKSTKLGDKDPTVILMFWWNFSVAMYRVCPFLV